MCTTTVPRDGWQYQTQVAHGVAGQCFGEWIWVTMSCLLRGISLFCVLPKMAPCKGEREKLHRISNPVGGLDSQVGSLGLETFSLALAFVSGLLAAIGLSHLL